MANGVKVDFEIKELIVEYGLADLKWLPLINTSSLDVTVASEILLLVEYPEHLTRYERSQSTKDAIGNVFLPYNLDNFHWKPGQRILAKTEQNFRFPTNISGQLSLKSSRCREFCEHLEAGWINAGHQGNLTLELINLSHNILPLKTGMRIAQIVFFEHAHAQNAYNGKYQNIENVSPSLAT